MTQKNQTQQTQQITPKSSRIISIDITRAIAILIMLGNHIIHATLNAKFMGTSAYNSWEYYRSFTAPLFLTISGCVFFVATKTHWDRHTFFNKSFNKRILRGLFLIVLGYVLQLPGKYFSSFETLQGSEYYRLVGSNILKLIGLMLIILEIMIASVRREGTFVVVAGFLFVAGAIVSPIIWQIPWGDFPQNILMGYLNGNPGNSKTLYSVFTIFPFGFFMFGGILIGWFWTRDTVINYSAKRWVIMLFAGCLMLYIGYLINNNIEQEWMNPRAKLAPFFKHFGAAILIIVIIDMLCKMVKPPNFLKVAGGETLGIYFLHMPIVYASIYNRGLWQRVGQTKSLAYSLIAFVIIAIVLIAVVNGWAYLRKKDPRITRIIIASLFALGILNGFLKFY
ncbi:MAG: heparan-alpha-glucosaminide N-acetyltransferase domain-containing protein [Planctomycetes bacterium]|nr:heparan-alpha-glucosaminide N-acetyltransferase domain-containing protein [Planctomycetota bacterium]